MRYLFFVTWLLVGFFPISCGNKGSSDSSNFSNPANTFNPSPKVESKCTLKNQDQCELNILDNCIWNFDRCMNKILEYAPVVPKELGKVKMVAVGKGFCAIDMNDELWCIPQSILERQILPRPTKKYRHVAMAIDAVLRSKICATELDGTSVCFDKGKEEKGPTTDKVLETIPSPHHDTICAFSQKKLYCESNQKAFEKLDDFSNDPDIQRWAKKNATDAMPDFQKIAFLGSNYGSDAKKFFTAFSSSKVLVGVRDDTKASLWDMAKLGSGRAAIYEDVLSFSTYNEAYCIIAEDKKGLVCDGGKYHSLVDTPKDIQNADLVQVATALEHTCVILKGSGELKCWGAKRKIKNMPPNLSGVKQVAVSEEMTCFIDKADMLNCFGE
jgi:hypothetical protein